MAPAVESTWDQVLAWRLHRHLLDRPAGLDPAGIVARLAGVQAQVPSSAQHAIATRRAEAGADVTAALTDRTLVRTWAMRGTLHLLPGEQLGAYLALVASGRTWLKAPWQREFATAAQMEALADAASAVLPGAVFTRDELVGEFAARVADPGIGQKLGSGWGVLLKPLAWQGLLCQALPRDGRVTFTAPSTWLPSWGGLPDPQVAARTVVPAYLAAHGPADPVRFDQWLTRGALSRPMVRGWFADLAEDGVLAPVRVGRDAVRAGRGRGGAAGDDADVAAAAAPRLRPVRARPRHERRADRPARAAESGQPDGRVDRPGRRPRWPGRRHLGPHGRHRDRRAVPRGRTGGPGRDRGRAGRPGTDLGEDLDLEVRTLPAGREPPG